MFVMIRKHWRLSLSLVVLVIAAGPACSPRNVQQDNSPADQERVIPQTPSEPAPLVQEQVKGPISIAAVGDIMMGTDYPRDRLPEADGAQLFASLSGVLSEPDLTIGNLEGVLMDGGDPVKHCNDPRLCYLFRTPTRFAQRLSEAGFDAMSLANNHALDFGEVGRQSSQQALAQVGIQHAGPIGSIARWTIKGLNVAYIAFAPNRGVYSLLDIAGAQAVVAELAGHYDIVVVSFHGGAEGLDAQHLSFQMERFHGEERGDLVAFSHAVIDAGADLVLGHGPHVLRAVELYRDRLIAYSLGNFCTYSGISVAGDKGLAPVLTVSLDETGRLISGQIIAARQQRPQGPVIDPSARAVKMMQRLTQADFPQASWEITADGQILRRESTPSVQPELTRQP